MTISNPFGGWYSPLSKQKAVLFPRLFHFSLARSRESKSRTWHDSNGDKSVHTAPVTNDIWNAGVHQTPHQWGINKKIHFRRANINTEQKITSSPVNTILSLPQPRASPAFMKAHILITKASAETHRSALTCVCGWKWARVIPTSHWKLFVGLLYSPETRNAVVCPPLPLAYRRRLCERVKPLHLHETTQQICRSMRVLPVAVIGAKRGRGQWNTSPIIPREHFAFQPHRRQDDCGTAASMWLTFTKSGPPTMSRNYVSFIPLLSLNPFRPSFMVYRTTKIFILNTL